MSTMRRRAIGLATPLLPLAAALGVGGCTIDRHVVPVSPRAIASLCLVENDTLWSKDFLPALRDDLGRHGIATSVYRGPLPSGCSHRLEYTANWNWDFAVYLVYADIRIYEADTLIGRAEYDA